MGYLCGIGPGFGVPPREPHVYCDGCGMKHDVTSRYGLPCAWFMARKPPPKWTGRPDGNKRLDYCPKCKPSSTPESGSGTGAGT